jgi:hypothetical protein
LRALDDGEFDPGALADLAKKNLRTMIPRLREALRGPVRGPSRDDAAYHARSHRLLRRCESTQPPSSPPPSGHPNDVAISGLESIDDDQAYQPMDLFVAADAQAQVQEAVLVAVADLLNIEVDLFFFDTKSTYFETEHPDDVRRDGKSKDSRPGLPQIVLGVCNRVHAPGGSL